MIDATLRAGLSTLDNDADIDTAEALLKHQRSTLLSARIAAVLAGPESVNVEILDGGGVHQVTREQAADYLRRGTHRVVA